LEVCFRADLSASEAAPSRLKNTRPGTLSDNNQSWRAEGGSSHPPTRKAVSSRRTMPRMSICSIWSIRTQCQRDMTEAWQWPTRSTSMMRSQTSPAGGPRRRRRGDRHRESEQAEGTAGTVSRGPEKVRRTHSMAIGPMPSLDPISPRYRRFSATVARRLGG
jgi:hypothetical protein